MLAGYSRLSFSLAVIMLETTENVNLFLPIIFALFVSFAIGGIFNKSMYAGAVRVKGYPFLNEKVPMCNELITAEQIMSMPVVTLKYKSSVGAIHSMLGDHKFDGFPIVNNSGQCIGLIGRHSLMVILKHIDKIQSLTTEQRPKGLSSLSPGLGRGGTQDRDQYNQMTDSLASGRLGQSEEDKDTNDGSLRGRAESSEGGNEGRSSLGTLTEKEGRGKGETDSDL